MSYSKNRRGGDWCDRSQWQAFTFLVQDQRDEVYTQVEEKNSFQDSSPQQRLEQTKEEVEGEGGGG